MVWSGVEWSGVVWCGVGWGGVRVCVCARACLFVVPRSECCAVLCYSTHDVLNSDSVLDLGVDSISAVRFAALVKEKFQKEIPLQMLMQPTSLSDLALYIENSSTTTDQSNPAAKDLENSALLRLGDVALPPPQGSLEHNTHNKQTLLLTGATGFLGSFLLDELLRESERVARVYCIVRASSEKDGIERVKDTLEKKCLWDSEKWENNKSRIQVVLGDLDKPSLGIDEHKFGELAKEVTFLLTLFCIMMPDLILCRLIQCIIVVLL